MPITLLQGRASYGLAFDMPVGGVPSGPGEPRRSEPGALRRRVSKAASILVATCVATVGLTGLTMERASAALPGLTTPGRVYPAVNTIMNFSGTDPVSGDNLAIQVSGLTENNCNPTAGNNYSITGCPRIQMSLSTTKAGLLRIPDTTAITNLDANPDVDVLVNSTGVVITEATDSHGLDSSTFNFNGHPADIAATLAKLQFVPCQSQMGTTKVPAAPAGESPVEVDCGVTGGNPADEPIYEEKESADAALPTLTVVAIQGASAENFSRQIKIKVEGTNASPTLTVTNPPATVSPAMTNNIDGVLDVFDAEMCNLTICGAPYVDPGQKETDDQMMLVAWIPENNCGTFSLRGGAFTNLGSGTDNSIHKVARRATGLDLNDAEQTVAADAIAAQIETAFSSNALALDLSTQPASVTSSTKVFAGVGALAEIKYALSKISYDAPAVDTTCHLNVAVNDLGNNGRPVSYVGSPFGPETPFPGHATDDVPYEVPDAKGDVTSLALVVSDGHPNVTVSQTLAGALGDPAGPNKPSGFTITFSEPIDPASFTTSDLSLSTSSATGPGVGALVTVLPGLIYTVPVTATGDGTITLTMSAGAAYSAGHNGEAAHTSEAPAYADNSIEWDQTAPKVTINQKVGQADPTTTSPVVFTVVFDETTLTTPAEFTASDISFAGSTAGGTLVATVTQPSMADLSTYEVAVSGMTSSGTVVASVKANAITDLALNGSAASTSTDHTVQYNKPIVDNTPPEVTIDQAAGQSDPTTTSPITYTVVFTEPVTGFTTGDITLGGTAGATTATVTGSGANYTVTVTGMTQTGTVTATINTGKATDAANNPNNASTSTDNTVQYNQPVAQPIVVQSSGGAVTIAATGGQLVSASSAAPVVPPPSGYTLPVGQLSFTANTAAGGLVTFTITLPVPVTDYMKLIGGQWQAFPFDGETGAQINGNVLNVTIRDNGRGDSDPTMGVATDPGIPVNAVPAPPAPPAPAPAPVVPAPVVPAPTVPAAPDASGSQAGNGNGNGGTPTTTTAGSAVAGTPTTTVSTTPTASTTPAPAVTLPAASPVDVSVLPAAPIAAPAQGGDSVAFTGSQSTDIALAAMVLLVLGFAFVVAARRGLRTGSRR